MTRHTVLAPSPCTILALCVCVSLCAAQAQELLVNCSFAEQKDGVPVGWSVRNNKQEVAADATEAQHPDVGQALRVDIVRDGGSSYGEIAQPVAAKPNTVYRFQGDWRSTKAQTAFFQIKVIKNRKEAQRIQLGWSDTAWQRVVRDVNTGDADEIEVVCRYRQKKTAVGVVCWYTNLSLTVVADPAGVEDSVTAISDPIAPPIPKTVSFDFPSQNPNLKVAAPGTDLYVTVTGAGEKTGADWDNAKSAGGEGLQATFDAVGPGNTLFLGSGQYKDALLEVSAGGSGPMAMKRLEGVDTGGGLPVIVGSLDMDNIKNGWQTMFKGTADTGYWEVTGLRFRNCSCAFKLYGGNVGVRLSHIDITRVREGFTIEGMQSPTDAFATRDLIVSDCTVSIYTKRGMRIRDGVSDLRIVRVNVDAGGKDWVREAFPIGFEVDGDKAMPECRDITYIECSASGNWHPNGNGYWNADGFCAERRARGLVYVRCRAFNNTDGGWDDKSANPVLIDCVSMRNKRNYRFWSKPGPAFLQNCISAYAIDYKSGNPGVGFWHASGSYVRIENSTFYGNGCAISVEADGNPTFCELRNCILAGDKDAKLLSVEGGGEVSKRDTVECTIDDPDTDPRLTAPSADWDGIGDAFNSTRYSECGARF